MGLFILNLSSEAFLVEAMRTLGLSLSTGVLLILILAHASECGECEVYYLDQPVNHLTCYPDLFGLKLECTIYYKNDKNYDINWYKIPVDVNRADPENVDIYKRTNNVYNVPDGGKILNSRFRISSPNVGHAGIYWCQIHLRNEPHSVNNSFRPSSAFIFYPPERYSTFPPCSDEYHSQHQTTCATTGEDIVPPSAPSVSSTANNVSLAPNQVTTPIPRITIHQRNNSMSNSDANDIPPWGYAVIAGGGAVSLIIISVIVCILLVFCQNVQKYKARPPLKVITIPEDVTTHGKKQSRPLVPPRSSDMLATKIPYHGSVTAKQESIAGGYIEIHQATSTGHMENTAADCFPGPFINTNPPPGAERGGILTLSDPRYSLRCIHSRSSSSSSTIVDDDHIYQTIYPRCLMNDEACNVACIEASRQEVSASSSPKPTRLLTPHEGLSLAKPKPPPPRLWNSPKTITCPRIPPTQSPTSNGSSSSGVATMETTRGTSPLTVVDQHQSGACGNCAHYQALSQETKDYVSLYSTPQTCSATSVNQ